MSKEFWDEVARLKPASRIKDGVVIHPVLLVHCQTYEDAASIAVTAHWRYLEYVKDLGNIGQVEFGALLPVDKVYRGI